jgi:hypothetical protein
VGTLRGTSTVADAPGNHPVAQGAFGGVVGQGQLRVVEHDPEGIPVVEQLARERTRLRVPGVGTLEASREELGEHGGEGFSQGNARWGAAGSINGLHERIENREYLLAKASRVPIQAFGHAAGFAGDMSEAAQAPAVLALDPVAVAHQPVLEGFPKHALHQLTGTLADDEEGDRGTGKDPQPQ